jgi:hypothetical protein
VAYRTLNQSPLDNLSNLSRNFNDLVAFLAQNA